MGKADIDGLDAENGLIRAALSGAINRDFFGSGMPSLFRCVACGSGLVVCACAPVYPPMHANKT